jgi:hypothetical protein
MTITVSSDAGGTYGSIAVNGVEKLRLNADGSATLDGNPVQRYKVLGNKPATSGTSVDFSSADDTGIPAWARRVQIAFKGISLTSGNLFVCLLGTSGGYLNSGYEGTYQLQTISAPSTGSGGNYGLNFALSANFDPSDSRHGIATLVHMGGNLWAISGTSGLGGGGGANTTMFAGSVQLPGVLNSIRFALNGAGSFDGGNITVTAEG